MIEISKEPEYAFFERLCLALKMRWINQSVFLEIVKEKAISEDFLIRVLNVPNGSIANGAFIALSKIEGNHITKTLMVAMKNHKEYLGFSTDCSIMVSKRENFSQILEKYLLEGDAIFD